MKDFEGVSLPDDTKCEQDLSSPAEVAQDVDKKSEDQFNFVDVEVKQRIAKVKEFTPRNPLIGHYSGTVKGKFNDNYVFQRLSGNEVITLLSVTDLQKKMRFVSLNSLVRIYWDGYESLPNGNQLLKVVVQVSEKNKN